MLGAGGAGRAIAFALTEAGAELTISNRTASKAEKLISEIEEKTAPSKANPPEEKRSSR